MVDKLVVLVILAITTVMSSQFTCLDVSMLRYFAMDQQLNGFTLETIWTSSLMKCGRECLYQTNCLSVNFNLNTGSCELNRNIGGVSFPLVSNTRVLYANRSEFQMILTNQCKSHSCPENHKCIIDFGTAKCIVFDCGIPPSVVYGHNLTYHGTVLSNVATYSCSGPGVVREDVTLTCDKNGQWVGEFCRKISSCLQIKQCKKNYTDGEYWLYPLKYNNIQRVKIYCYGLNTTTPLEYVTLIHENRITSPNNLQTSGCSYTTHSHQSNGEAVFRKIRVNLHMEIIPNDVQFMELLWGNNQKYGTTFDCGTKYCSDIPHGTLNIDTRGTGLMLDPNTQWTIYGYKPGMFYINRISDNVIEIKCGGHCGGCEPETELQLQIDTHTILDVTEAIEVKK